MKKRKEHFSDTPSRTCEVSANEQQSTRSCFRNLPPTYNIHQARPTDVRLKGKTAVSQRGLNALQRSRGSWMKYVCEGINLNLLYQGEIWQRLGRRMSESAGNSRHSTGFRCQWIPLPLDFSFLLTGIQSKNQSINHLFISCCSQFFINASNWTSEKKWHMPQSHPSVAGQWGTTTGKPANKLIGGSNQIINNTFNINDSQSVLRCLLKP